jgi:hypothetical protein
MNEIILKNVMMNLVFVIVFVILNNWVLQQGLEETFVSLALIYGIIVVFTNAFFVARFCKK